MGGSTCTFKNIMIFLGNAYFRTSKTPWGLLTRGIMLTSHELHFHCRYSRPQSPRFVWFSSGDENVVCVEWRSKGLYKT